MTAPSIFDDRLRVKRCAIYTRKSTDEGLDSEFNSLDAQRDSCAAFIASQRHENWVELSKAYDDGGYSGGSLERPAFQRLLADVRDGKVDVIVVYKVDRLTRSLLDFARIVGILDEAGASFVSITQAFNSTTSMGRLTLNVLLSFAQFEREIASERVRDKIAASKAKGIWMGGTVPLGYDLLDRRLVVNESEAAIVRHIFARYLADVTGPALVRELARDGLRSKTRPLVGSTAALTAAAASAWTYIVAVVVVVLTWMLTVGSPPQFELCHSRTGLAPISSEYFHEF